MFHSTASPLSRAPPGHAFSLLRYFVISISVTVPIVIGCAAYWTDRALREELFEEAREYARAVAGNVHKHLESEQLLGPLAAVGLPHDPGQLEKARKIVNLAVSGHDVERVYLFDDVGRVIFSTEFSDIGRQVSEAYDPIRRALKGEVVSLVRTGESSDLSSMPRESRFLETYVPVNGNRSVDDRVRVVEIYQDMENLDHAVADARKRVVAITMASMAALGTIFALLSIKADRILRLRGGEILASNAELQRLSSGLEREIEARTQQLIGKEKLASLGTLAAGVAHEINTPLATVATCVDGSLSRLEEERPSSEDIATVRSYLRVIDGEVFRCKRITESLLGFSREDSSSLRSDIDLNALARQTVDVLKLGPAKEVPIDFELAAEADGVGGYPEQLRQVIHNLLSNSLDAVRGLERPRIVLRTGSSAAAVFLECIDNGPGIPMEIRSSVFEPFFTTKFGAGGTGLGLSVCYGILQRHGGSLAILDLEEGSETRRGGARVRLTLPRTSGAARTPQRSD